MRLSGLLKTESKIALATLVAALAFTCSAPASYAQGDGCIIVVRFTGIGGFGQGITSYSFSAQAPGWNCGEVRDLVIETDHGNIEFPGELAGREGNARMPEFVPGSLDSPDDFSSLKVGRATGLLNGSRHDFTSALSFDNYFVPLER